MMKGNNEDTLLDISDDKTTFDIKHGGYYIGKWIKDFFSDPLKQPKRELDVLDSVKTLLEVGDNTEANVKICQQLTHLHRVIENTKARRRLERWSSKVITVYLFITLSVVLLCYTKSPVYHYVHLEIPDSIMITVLSTTTINIIGLGLIVLRGHFLLSDKENVLEKKSKKKK